MGIVANALRNAPKAVTIKITATEIVTLEMDHPRDLVRLRFFEKGYIVINFMELKYFYQKDHVIVEGNTGLSLLSK